MEKKKVWTISLLTAAVIFAGCYKDNAEDMYPANPDCDTTGVTYTNTIAPLMQSKCLSCHTGTGMTGIDLSTYNGVAAAANSGSLLDAINHTGPNPMPQGQPKLDDCTIEKVTKWVNDGAPNN